MATNLSLPLRIALTVVAATCFACANTDGDTTPSNDATAATDGGSSSGGATDTGGSSSGGAADTGGSSSGGTTDTGGGSGSTAKEMTVEEVLKLAQTAQPKVAKCPQFVNPPAGKKIAVKGLRLVTPVYGAAKTLDGVFVQSGKGGPYSGLRLVGEKGKAFKDLKKGDVIDIEGQVVVFYCEVQVSVDKVTKTDAAVEAPVSVTVTFDDVGESAASDKVNSYEAAFISLENVVITDKEALGTDGKPHGEIWIGAKDGDKSLMVKADLKWPVTFYSYDKDSKKWSTSLTDGTKLKSISGILTYSFEHWKLMPLSDDMLVFE